MWKTLECHSLDDVNPRHISLHSHCGSSHQLAMEGWSYFPSDSGEGHYAI